LEEKTKKWLREGPGSGTKTAKDPAKRTAAGAKSKRAVVPEFD